jgi:hypothetical protein
MCATTTTKNWGRKDLSVLFGSRCTLQKLTMQSPVCNDLRADGVRLAKTRCSHFAALQFSGGTEITIAERPDL